MLTKQEMQDKCFRATCRAVLSGTCAVLIAAFAILTIVGSIMRNKEPNAFIVIFWLTSSVLLVANTVVMIRYVATVVYWTIQLEKQAVDEKV